MRYGILLYREECLSVYCKFLKPWSCIISDIIVDGDFGPLCRNVSRRYDKHEKVDIEKLYERLISKISTKPTAMKKYKKAFNVETFLLD